MLIHTDGNEYICNHVEFIEYTGCFPNLCSGTLTLKNDNVPYGCCGGCA